MEYDQLKNLLQLKGIRDKESVAMLEELVEKFPYFQSARLLLAKSLHDQQDIHSDEAIKLAAAYATDRKVLHELIEDEISQAGFDFSYRKTESVAETRRIIPPIEDTEPLIQSPEEKEPFTEWYSEDEISGRAFEEQEQKERLVDPYKIIRQRLSEILITKEDQPKSKQQEETKEVKVESKKAEVPIEPPIAAKVESIEETTQEQKEEIPIPTIEKEEITPVEKPDMEEIINQEAKKAGDDLDKMEIEHAMQESILASLEKLPVIKKEEPVPEKVYVVEKKISPAPKPDLSSSMSFTGWLTSLSSKPFSQFEELHSVGKSPVDSMASEETLVPSDASTIEESDTEISDDELIERFIVAEPKIVPSKAEFYSPANQAKKSVMEHEDVVSETLARIYLNQGNLSKAKWCYEKLSLLHPEKSSYFAALLKEIDQQISNKEDS